MNYQEHAARARSQKALLATVEAKEMLKLFTQDGLVYKRSVDYFVVAVNVNGINYNEAPDQTLGLGEFYYNATEGMLYVRLIDDTDPKASSLYATYRLFFSNMPANAPSGVISGSIVHYDARIERIGGLKLELDFENTGIALETDSSITLENNDGFFDNIFDTLIFENGSVKFYSWSPSIAFTEAKLIYKGFISDKSFSTQSIGFTLKDQLSVLRQPLDWGRFSSLDGDIDDSIIGKPKRLIFGRVDNIRLTGVDKTLGGFILDGTISGDADRNLLTGTVSGASGSSTITGVGTLFTTELSPGDRIRIVGPFVEYTYTVNTITNNNTLVISGTISDSFSNFQARNQNVSNNIIEGVGTDFINEVSPDDKIVVSVNGTTYELGVESVDSATQLTLQDEIEVTFNNAQGRNLPEIPYRKKNRRWHISGHKLREYSVQVTAVSTLQVFEVDDPLDIEQGDYLKIGLFTYVVLRISTNIITLNQNVREPLNVGDFVTKIPVSECLADDRRFIIDRDFTLDNTISDCVLEFNDIAEFNTTSPKNPTITFSFVSGSNLVNSVASDIDLTTIIKPRDWIRARSVNLPDWYEVLSVRETQITLRTNALATFSGQAQVKNVSYIGDNSLVAADCLGLEHDGEWVRYPANAVKWLILQANESDINVPSFTEAADDCRMDLALYYPDQIGSEMPVLRDMISAINESVFGSLYLNPQLQYTYKILNADKPIDMPEVKDEDIIGFRVNTKTNTINSVLLSYSPFVDTKAQSETFKTIILESSFVNQAIGKKEQLKVTCYLFRESDAQTIAQRWLFFRSLTQSVITITTKLQYSLLSLNSPMLLDISRLYRRYGSTGRRKIGLINSITKDGANTIIQVNDLGNVFNRVPAIASNDALDYSEGSEELDRFGYIVDNLTETPDIASEAELGSNLIG
jgi:hypothetical protein